MNRLAYIAKGTRIRAGYVVNDGPCEFHPKTAIVTVRGSGRPPTDVFDVVGNIVFQLDGQNPDGWYSRRFAVQAWGSVSIQIDQFSGFKLTVLGCSLPTTFDAVCIVTDGEEASSQPLLLYPEVRLGATAAVVPWGAVELVCSTADPGFAWSISDQNGSVITVSQALTAGQTVPVGGLRYVPSVSPFRAVWRIRP